MDAYRLMVWAHLLFAILLVGMGLFWFIMDISLTRRFGRAASQDWLNIVNSARWPHVAVPHALRLPLPWMAWLIVALLVGSGVLSARLVGRVPSGPIWWAKGILFVVLIGALGLLARQPARAVIRVVFVAVIMITMVSVVAIR